MKIIDSHKKLLHSHNMQSVPLADKIDKPQGKRAYHISDRPQKQRRPAHPEELDQIARELADRYWNPEFLKDLEEPEGLASGKLSKAGTFVNRDDEDEQHK